MPELFRLPSADTFRDLAGPGEGYPTADGRRVRPGRVFRSNELQLTDEDVLTLTGFGLAAIHDLRTPEEVDAHPDVVLPGADWRPHPMTGIPLERVTDLERREDGTALMERVYRGFVDDPRARRGFAGLLRDLAAVDGPQLFHCTNGRDRTGWAAALLLHVLGVPGDVVEADYLLTNQYAESWRARYRTMVETALGSDRIPAYEPLLAADATYLLVALDAADRSFGGLDSYLSEGLGVDDQLRGVLRERLTA